MDNTGVSGLPRPKKHWVNILFLTITPIVGLIISPIYVWFNPISQWIVVFAVFLLAATAMSITAGYHRLFAHRSYQANRFVKWLFVLVGSAAFEGSVLQWVYDHRRHHRYVDTEQDPHNIRQGFWWAHIGWLLFKDQRGIKMEAMPDLARDPLLRFQHDYYVAFAIGVNVVVSGLVGLAFGSFWGGILVAGVTRIVFANHITFLINSLAHTLGKRPYSDKQTARDSVVMAVLAYGEGYHNFHHQFASDYRNGIRWYHWDPTKWLIRGLSFFGWTYGLKTTPASEILKARLRTESSRLMATGVPAEKVISLKTRVEEAQARWRLLKEDYRRLKTSMANRSSERLAAFKGEMKMARLEFKLALAQWSVFRRTYRHAVPLMMK